MKRRGFLGAMLGAPIATAAAGMVPSKEASHQRMMMVQLDSGMHSWDELHVEPFCSGVIVNLDQPLEEQFSGEYLDKVRKAINGQT